MNEDVAQFDTTASGDELMELAVLHLDGWLDSPRRDRLNALLANDTRSRDAFVAVCTHASLLASCVGINERPVVGDREPEFEDRKIFDQSLAIPSLSPLSFTLSPSFVGGPVFSYMVATVVLCLMLLGAWAYKISHIRSIAPDMAASSTRRLAPIFVGRVTGMKNCRWSDANTQTVIGASAPLGREYALASGLMEITYSSGARVILEGPCTYKVESSAGGFLERGKLTAKIRTQSSNLRTQSSKPFPLSSPSSPLFCVRTPTAVVADLGTEFGVEVDENGDTISHVFQGSVKVRTVDEHSWKEVLLRQNEWARVEKSGAGLDGGAPRIVIVKELAAAPKFVRRMSKPVSVSGGYDGGYDPYDASPPPGQSTWLNGGATLVPTPNDDNGLPSPGLANFNDPSSGQRLSVYRPMGSDTFGDDQANDEFTFTARLKLGSADMTTTPSLALICLGFRNEWNGGDDYGKVVMLGWFYNNPNDGDNPGLWLVERRTMGSAQAGAVKINNVNYFDDAWHTYRVDKVLERGTAKVKVYVDGALKVKIGYDTLPAAESGDDGFGYFSSTPGAVRATVDYFEYRVYAPPAPTSKTERFSVGAEDDAGEGQSPRDGAGKEVVN
ncbi:MAG: hypothetical protein JW959_05035 [Pirellulales bacterium]|nr:hypothetical protein [Pirellulales bacterium]